MNSRLQQFFTFVVAVTTLSGCEPDRTLAPDNPTFARQASAAGSAPSEISSTAQSESEIMLAWTDNSSNESGFELHRSITGASGTFTPHTTTGPDVTSLLDSGLTAATEYCYMIRSVVTKGRKTTYSSFTNVSCATTLAPPVTPSPPPPPTPPPPSPTLPSAPTSILVTPATSFSVTVNWSWVENAEGYRIERSTNGGSSWVTAGTHSGTHQEFTDTGRTPEQPVSYRVFAFNNNGESVPSLIRSTTPPAYPTDVVAVPIDEQTVEIRWTDNSSVEDGYWVVTFYYECYDWGCYYDAVYSDYTLPANTTSHRVPRYQELYGVMAIKDGGYSSWGSISSSSAASPSP
jgi:hypothetical protein